jgi:hypothetical protein
MTSLKLDHVVSFDQRVCIVHTFDDAAQETFCKLNAFSDWPKQSLIGKKSWHARLNARPAKMAAKLKEIRNCLQFVKHISSYN